MHDSYFCPHTVIGGFGTDKYVCMQIAAWWLGISLGGAVQNLNNGNVREKEREKGNIAYGLTLCRHCDKVVLLSITQQIEHKVKWVITDNNKEKLKSVE